jgi:hypothetical protein
MNQKVTCRSLSFFILGLCLSMSGLSVFANSPCAPMTLDQLPLLPRNVSVHEFSSHNKQGVNGDSEWCLYKDEKGDFVAFDAVGPGCVRSIWQTCFPTDQVIKFYFDGETEPRYVMPTVDFYRGKHPDFPSPLNSYEKLGYFLEDSYAGNCFTPIPFAKSLKIAFQGSCTFNHFFCERYPYGTPVTTFNGKEDRSYLLKAFAQKGEELNPLTDAEVIRSSAKEFKPGEQLELLNVEKAGTVARIVIEGENSEEFVRQAELMMQWDDNPRPEVLAAVGMFFGPAVRPEEVRSMPTKVEILPEGRIRMTSYFRMPFWRKAKIFLNNRPDATAKTLGPVSAEVHLVPQRYVENETGYFCALYRDGRTEMARDWLFFDAAGTGRFVGVVQTMLGGHYCEGNERFVVDGAGMPQVSGTGTEDYYLACLWPNPNYNMPFAGCIGDIKKQPGTACYYRFHLETPIPFYSSLDARIQHGGMSDIVSHYQSLGFCYFRKRPVLKQTDFLDVANEASERTHGYQAADSKLTDELEASYEGNLAGTLVRDRGRTHDGGEIAFTVAIDPDNHGVRLRRRLDQGTPRQAADVYVNDKFAGTWYHADQNPFLRWSDSEYDLPGEMTQGKTELKIRLVVKKEEGYGPFNDYRYEVLTFMGK